MVKNLPRPLKVVMEKVGAFSDASQGVCYIRKVAIDRSMMMMMMKMMRGTVSVLFWHTHILSHPLSFSF
jgi:hypothetical protein